MNDLNRFESKYIKSQSGCWNWTAYLHASGYGVMKYNGRSELAHRVSWMIHRGTIPTKLQILHKCNNRKCVNPEHLYLGTQYDNVQDAIQAGTHTSVHSARYKAALEQIVRTCKSPCKYNNRGDTANVLTIAEQALKG